MAPMPTKSHRLFFALTARGDRVEFLAVRSEIGEQCAVTLNGLVQYVAAPTARGVDSALDRFRQLSRTAAVPGPVGDAVAPRRARAPAATAAEHASIFPEILLAAAAANAAHGRCHGPAAA